ncbi:MAG: hypothetical protein ACOC1O_01410 [bacterium]
MKEVTWFCKYNIGIEKIDEHRKSIFDAIINSYDAFLKKEPKDYAYFLELSSHALKDLMIDCFNVEDVFYETIDYPLKNDQKFIHNYYIEELKKFHNIFEENSDTIPYKTCEDYFNMLNSLVLKHVFEMDLLVKEYIDLAKNKSKYNIYYLQSEIRKMKMQIAMLEHIENNLKEEAFETNFNSVLERLENYGCKDG